VNSYHGSAIIKAPEGADVLVIDDEKYIESWIHKNIMAIVWHPERDKTHWMPEEIKNTIGV
jgi:gamma-glutamyl-gamma-aminobutyrate hydrolase PuuD